MGQARIKLLTKLSQWRHRYAVIRVVTLSLTLGVLFLVPLSGLARVDLWGGEHEVLGERAGVVRAVVAVLLGIFAFYALTFLLNIFLGRLFCGWGCPVGQLSRFGDALDRSAAKGRRLYERALSGLFAGLLTLSVMAWWVSPRVLLEGSPTALAVTSLTFVSSLILMWIHAKYWRWGFCRKLCPIGLYYSVVTSESAYGIVFHSGWDSCKDCDLCTKICPVELEPRVLQEARNDIGGVAIDGLPGANHCLTCGDCVRVCEWVFRGDAKPEACPLVFGSRALDAPPQRASTQLAAPCDQHSARSLPSSTEPEPRDENRGNEDQTRNPVA